MDGMISCRICGEDNPRVIEEHHKLPKRYGGPDSEGNVINLCANCHRSIEQAYNKQFWTAVFEHVRDEFDRGDLFVDERDKMKKLEEYLIKKIRYDLIQELDEEGYTRAEIADFIERMNSLNSITQQRVGQLVRSSDFDEAYSYSSLDD